MVVIFLVHNTHHGTGTLNDLHVDPQGRVYVGSLGIELWDPDPATVMDQS